jgi:hypothetical protein
MREGVILGIAREGGYCFNNNVLGRGMTRVAPVTMDKDGGHTGHEGDTKTHSLCRTVNLILRRTLAE